MLCTYSDLFFAPVSFLYLCVLLLNFLAKHLLHLLFHLLHLEKQSIWRHPPLLIVSFQTINMMAPASNHWPHLQLVPQSLILDDSKRVLVRDCRLGLVDCSQRTQFSAPWGGMNYDYDYFHLGRHGIPIKGTNRKQILSKLSVVGPNFPSKMTVF